MSNNNKLAFLDVTCHLLEIITPYAISVSFSAVVDVNPRNSITQ